MKSENESENDHCKNGGRVHFSKNDHFQLILMFIFLVHFLKNGRKMKTENEAKMAEKWLL